MPKLWQFTENYLDSHQIAIYARFHKILPKFTNVLDFGKVSWNLLAFTALSIPNQNKKNRYGNVPYLQAPLMFLICKVHCPVIWGSSSPSCFILLAIYGQKNIQSENVRVNKSYPPPPTSHFLQCRYNKFCVGLIAILAIDCQRRFLCICQKSALQKVFFFANILPTFVRN